ncbi:GNAT family N-acetyltransferase [Cellulomonas cellasea]|uniref:GNAT superfamily N-acetyltransferase n=1 Tax=Cellulomonas cellasea TaxID=43670 RepID=A0A7W4UC21_9CELL|nr:GNAT family N-acetyltransferase [Cellulomonas cellasea]MBB2921450.1 GNAT superfamily N-acetyltransferase [Cellulomonas cellasea]
MTATTTRPARVPGEPAAGRPTGATGGASAAAVREVRSVLLDDPLVRPLLDELAHEYATRYAEHFGVDALRAEMARYPAHEFAAPDGELVLVLEDGVPVAGGAFRRRVEPELGDASRLARADARAADATPAVATAELKRIWTASAHRRRGLARVVLAELEERAARAGYARVYLTTGPRQPEAAALYLHTGYTPLFDPAVQPSGPLPFEKWLGVTP